jgi:hypothetical protein
MYIANGDISNEKSSAAPPLLKPRQNSEAVWKVINLYVGGHILLTYPMEMSTF